MSSSIDYFDCPQCGGSAYREQDNKTCEIRYGCSNCSWKGEVVEKQEIQAYQKVTMGFVVQNYILNQEGKYVCIEQSFQAADAVTRENEDGDPVEVDISKEVYQTLDMEQPRSMTFDQWYQENKHNDSVQRLYRGVIENDPDYSLTFREWCETYFRDCVDI